MFRHDSPRTTLRALEEEQRWAKSCQKQCQTTPMAVAQLFDWRPVKWGRVSTLSCGTLDPKWGASITNHGSAGRLVNQKMPHRLQSSNGLATYYLDMAKWRVNREIHPTFQLKHGRYFCVFWGIISQLKT